MNTSPNKFSTARPEPRQKRSVLNFFSDRDEDRADEREQTHNENAGEGVEPNDGSRFHARLPEDLMHDRFNSIRISLTQIGSAGRGNDALNARLPEHGAVADSYQLEFSQNPHKL